MMRRRNLLHPVLLTLLLALPAQSTPQQKVPVLWRVYHLFNPSDPTHQQDSERLHDALADRVDVDVIDIRFGTSVDETGAASWPSVQLQQWPAEVKSWLATGAGDRLLVHHTPSDRTWSGRGTDLGQLVAEAGMRSIRTDVGVTTWGKVKDLFR